MSINDSVIAVCVDSSHQRGMGHLYRMLNLIEVLRHDQKMFILIVNDDEIVKKMLDDLQLKYLTADYEDTASNWESRVIGECNVGLWINDRLNTKYEHSVNVKNNDNVKLITFDDMGDGAKLADVNIAALVFDDKQPINGKKVLRGSDYLILNKEVDECKRLRRKKDKILVTIGGSDTYGMAIKILRMLKDINVPATVHIGPLFEHYSELKREITDSYPLTASAQSLVREFDKYDLAITGGGITPFEANAAGLPCLVISCEEHEKQICNYLDSMGSSLYLGQRDELCADHIKKALDEMDVEEMSSLGMKNIPINGIDNVWACIKELIDE